MRGPQDASYPAMNAALLQAQRVIKSDPAVQNVIGFTGGGGATNTGNMFVILKPLNAAGRTQRGRGDQPAAPEAEPDHRRVDISAGVAGPAHRRTRQQRACTSTRSRPTT